MQTNKKTYLRELGKMAYQTAWDYQTSLFQEIVNTKLENRKQEDIGGEQHITPNHFLFVEHPPVYTLGKSGDMGNVLINQEEMEKQGVSFFKINRGGDITFHGPGQIVGYPILDLDNFFTDIHRYMRQIEEVIIQTLAQFDIEAGRVDGLTGVWIDYDSPSKARKICAIGVKMSRWVTMHGFALNVNTDLGYFNNIVPCGISDKAVTSMQKELGKAIPLAEVQKVILDQFEHLFEMAFEPQPEKYAPSALAV